jgi:hypothetical protein
MSVVAKGCGPRNEDDRVFKDTTVLCETELWTEGASERG